MVKVKELIDLYNKDLEDYCEVNVEVNGDSRNIEKYYDLEVSAFTVSSYDGDDTLYIYVDSEQKWKIDDPLNVFN
jgi:hypothetical protein